VVFACAAAAGQANVTHAGWPAIDNLVIDKDTSGAAHVLRGTPGVHNELLGGYGSDTIYGNDAGDVIWTNYHPDYTLFDQTMTWCPGLSAYINLLAVKPATRPDLLAVKEAFKQSDAQCQALPARTGKPVAVYPRNEVGTVHAGNGKNFIYATDTTNFVWTGTGPTIVHASTGGGVIHCESDKVIVFLSKRSRPHYQLPGCKHLTYRFLGFA